MKLAFGLTNIRLGCGFGACALLLNLLVPLQALAQTANADEPQLLPLRRFVANTDVMADFRLAPNGEKLLWTEAVGTTAGFAVREIGPLAAGAAAGVDPVLSTPVRRFAVGRAWHVWLADSRHLLMARDADGSENTQLLILDTDAPNSAPRVLTPWPGSKSGLVSIRHAKPGWFYFESNRRDKKTFDLYEAEVASGATREVLQSDGTVVQWLIDSGDGWPGARVRNLERGRVRVLEVNRAAMAEEPIWERVFEWDGHAMFGGAHRIDRRAGFAMVIPSGISGSADKAGLARLSLADKNLTPVHGDARVDYTVVNYTADSAEPYAIRYDPDYATTHVFDPVLREELTQALAQRFGTKLKGMTLGGLDHARRRLLVYPQVEAGAMELLFDRATRSFVVLRDVATQPETAHLATMRPISFAARDGRTIHGYLTQPKHLEGKPGPLIAVIHGGPWVRNTWSGKSLTGEDALWAQILANRGYGVLQVNYRGSTGYGREHLDAGVRELGAKTQDDIEDGVNWVVAQGLADPKRLGVAGRSFGGYSTLMQLTRTPEKYACGVSIVGVANWVRQIEAQPPYWANFRHIYDRFYGDPAKPEDRTRLMAQSPVTQLDKLRAPLLLIHGANDVRVLKEDSEDVAAALKAQGKSVDTLIFADEGHSITKWQNRLKMYRRIEEFFAKCLGGRDGGFDLFQLAGQ